MGYTIMLYTAPAGAVLGTLTGGAARPDHPWLDDVDDVDATARRVAAAVAAGGRDLDEQTALFVAATIATVGDFAGEWFHTSGGGEEFRRRVLGGVLAPRFGAERVAQLLLGPIGGCTFPDYPTCGIWSPDEAAAARSAADAVGDDDLDPDDRRTVHLLRRVAGIGADHHRDVLSVYT